MALDVGRVRSSISESRPRFRRAIVRASEGIVTKDSEGERTRAGRSGSGWSCGRVKGLLTIIFAMVEFTSVFCKRQVVAPALDLSQSTADLCLYHSPLRSPSQPYISSIVIQNLPHNTSEIHTKQHSRMRWLHIAHAQKRAVASTCRISYTTDNVIVRENHRHVFLPAARADALRSECAGGPGVRPRSLLLPRPLSDPSESSARSALAFPLSGFTAGVAARPETLLFAFRVAVCSLVSEPRAWAFPDPPSAASS